MENHVESIRNVVQTFTIETQKKALTTMGEKSGLESSGGKSESLKCSDCPKELESMDTLENH